MGELVADMYMTLDGVVQAPGEPEEDVEGGFAFGGWQVPYLDADSGRVITDGIGRIDALLLGRKTYEIFAAYWPQAPDDHPIANRLNSITKYVVSRTLDQLTWNNASLIEGDAVEGVAKLKQEHRSVHVIGSVELTKTLISAGPVDVYNLWLYPVVVGRGKKLFADDCCTQRVPSHLVDDLRLGDRAPGIPLRRPTAVGEHGLGCRSSVQAVDLLIRTMHPEEFEAMKDLSVAAFDGNHQIEVLIDHLHESWAWDDELSFVAERGGQLVGQVLYTHALLDTAQRLVDVLVLSPVAVRPDLQNRGIGSQLIRESLARLSQSDEAAVFLEGHPDYYPRFGFQRASDLGFTAPSVRVSSDAFMAHRLPKYETWITGALVYPDAFWRADAVGLRDSSSSSKQPDRL